MSTIYTAIAIIALAVIALVAIYAGRSERPKRLSRLALLGFFCIILGIVFVDDRLVGYSFIGIGVILSVIDITRKLRK